MSQSKSQKPTKASQPQTTPKSTLPPALMARCSALAKKSSVPMATLLEEHGERSAIREYVGGMPRADAEVHAMMDVETMFAPPKKGRR